MLAQEGSPGVKRFVGDDLQVPRGDSGDIAGDECGLLFYPFWEFARYGEKSQ
jgi:hypothetical protein